MAERVSLKPYGVTMDKEREALVFTHIPKTAGTSLHEAISSALDGDYAVLTPATVSKIDFDSIGGVGGHQPFLATPLGKTKRNMVHITILRDPVDRLVSFHGHVKANPNHALLRLYPQIKDLGPLEFAEFLSARDYGDIRNLQCHMVCGNRVSASFGTASASLRNNFSVFGTVENLDLFLHRLAILLGVDQIDMPFKNKGKAKRAELAYKEQRALKAFVHKISPEDVSLFNWVREQEQEAYRNLL